MYKKLLKSSILSFIFCFVCFGFAGCGNQRDDYNADEVTNSANDRTESLNDTGTEDMTSEDNSSQDNAGHADSNMDGSNSPGQDLENAGENLGQGIEDVGESIVDGAEDLLDGDQTGTNTEKQNMQ